MKATVLVDNITNGRLKSEWGLSIFIEYLDKKILLDFGASNIFLENSQDLEIDLRDVDISFLSHAHFDHGNGLGDFLEYNKKAKAYISSAVEENCYSIEDDNSLTYEGLPIGTLEKYESRLVRCKGLTKISYGIYALFHSTSNTSKYAKIDKMLLKENGIFRDDDLLHEHTLIFDTNKGLVVFSSCSHIGADNIINEVKDAFPNKIIYSIIGGFHLYNKTNEYVKDFANRLNETGVEKVITGHCTGDKAYNILKEELKDKLEKLETGLIIEF